MNSFRTLVHLSRRVNTVNSIRWKQSVRLMCSADVNKLVIKRPDKVSMDLPQDDLEREMMAIYEEEEKHRTRSILVPVEDESQVYAEPAIPPTYNLAAYVQRSETLQKMIGIGVNLHRIEYNGHGEFVAKLDFDRDIQPYIILLCKDIGLSPDDLGFFFTKNIFILKNSLDEISTRVNYLHLKQFTKENIVHIIKRSPRWLNYSTKNIDKRLGHFQNLFKLTGKEVRLLTLERPGLILSDLNVVRDATFTLREEFGFENVKHLKQIILKCPILLELGKIAIPDYIKQVEIFIEKFRFQIDSL